jgi:hypothetical protein
MRLLFITSCTGRKAHKLENQLVWDDFRLLGTEALWQKEESLDAFRLPARDMYTGQQHVRLLRGLDALRKACPQIRVDLKIISAGYGLIDENVPIVPYEMTFNTLKAKALREWADFLKLPYWVLSVMAVYDLTIFLLGEKYLRAVNLPPKLEIPGACIFLTGKGSRPYLPSGPDVQTIFLANQDAKRLGAGLVALKGRVVEILGEHVNHDPGFIERMFDSPALLGKLIREYPR